MNERVAPPLVVHIIYALGTGGLENGLVNIINRTPPGSFRHAIVCLTEAGEFAGRIAAPNVPVIELHKRPGHDWGLYWRLRWRAPLLSGLTGFMIGAAVQLWPWQLGGAPVLPATYVTEAGSAFLSMTLVSMLAGAVVIWALSRLEP